MLWDLVLGEQLPKQLGSNHDPSESGPKPVMQIPPQASQLLMVRTGSPSTPVTVSRRPQPPNNTPISHNDLRKWVTRPDGQPPIWSAPQGRSSTPLSKTSAPT